MVNIDTVAALLAKAEATDNEAEAAAYLAKAQHLATLGAIDLELAAASKPDARSRMVVRRIEVGRRRAHLNVHLIELFATIGHANDVVIDIAHNNTFLYAFGTTGDVDTAETMWLAAAPHMVDGLRRWVRSGAWKSTSYGYQTVREAKAAWAHGYTARIDVRLRQARSDAIAEHDHTAAADGGVGGGELVLVAKKDKVSGWHAQQSKARGSWAGYRGGMGSSQARSAGYAAGEHAPLSRPRQVGGRGRLSATG